MPNKTDVAEPLNILEHSRTPQLRSVLMENLSDKIMRQIAFNLLQKTRNSVQLLSCITSVISYESAMSSLPEVMLACTTEFLPLHGRMLVVVDGDFIGAIVDALCGSTISSGFERYELSLLEHRIGKQIISLTCATIEESLAPLIKLSLDKISYENSGGILAIADSQDWVVVVTGIFEATIGSGAIKIIIPYSTLEPLEVKVNNQSGLLSGKAYDIGWIKLLEFESGELPLDIVIQIARAKISIDDVVKITIGTVIPIRVHEFGVATSTEIDLFVVKYGQDGGRICCSAYISEENIVSSSNEMDEIKKGDQLLEAEPVELEPLMNTKPQRRPKLRQNAVDRVEVLLTVELGRTKMTVRDVRSIRHGQVVTLDQSVGDPLKIYINGQHLAYAEVVAADNDKYGVRITALVEDIDSRDSE
jgi:flagellar motor switch protein FliM